MTANVPPRAAKRKKINQTFSFTHGNMRSNGLEVKAGISAVDGGSFLSDGAAVLHC